MGKGVVYPELDCIIEGEWEGAYPELSSIAHQHQIVLYFWHQKRKISLSKK